MKNTVVVDEGVMCLVLPEGKQEFATPQARLFPTKL